MNETRKNANCRIRDWKGLIHEEPRNIKIKAFAALLVVSTSMTFTQFGFIGVGAAGSYLGYALGLLVPLASVALLMGKGSGALFGAISGAILYLHARIQPLDLFERYLTSFINSVVLYAFVGFSLGLIFAIALRNNPEGKRRVGYLALSCAVASVIATAAFALNGVLTIAFAAVPVSGLSAENVTPSSEWLRSVSMLNGFGTQMLCDFLLMFGVSLITDYVSRWRKKQVGDISVRTAFRLNLFVVTALVYCAVSAVGYALVTINSRSQTLVQLNEELLYLAQRLEERDASLQLIDETLKPYIQPEDQSEDQSGDEESEIPSLPAEVADALAAPHDMTRALDGYDNAAGTIVIFKDDTVVCSNGPAYPVGVTMSELFDTWRTGTLEELAETGRLQEMLYSTQPRAVDLNYDSSTWAELGYMCVRKAGDYYLLAAVPSTAVFASRDSTVTWVSVTAFVLLATIYVLAARLLGKDVISPIDRTNESLAKITSGNLEETVNEAGTREFASLSAGINETVGALRGLIDEAERRNERDLAVAKKIQESALPRTFPPYPEIDAFDIFAAMSTAKEVGGDFYDFFLVDDGTLGFLIADVSGKGIPGALFMMAAKTEIENYLSTGMEPAEAIASANRKLCANNDAGMFVTVWAATLDWKTGKLTYVNAGHNYPLLRHGNGGSWEWVKKKCGLFLGTFETAKYRQETLYLKPGDELLLYTDGVNEAFGTNGEEYGNDRLEAFLDAHADMHPRELVRSLRSDVARWADGAEQSDDITMLCLEYGVAPEVTGTRTVPATLEHLGEVNALIVEELEQRLCPVGVLHKVEIALEELFVNVCNYAYASSNLEGPGEVTVSYAYGTDPSSITVELRDKGVPFDPLRRDDPMKPSSIQEAKVGGLGIYMVKRTMDDIAYMRDGDENVVVFRKGW